VNDGPPAHTPAWRNFKRMQGSACLFGSLIYFAAVLRAWDALPGTPGFKAAVFLGFPGVFFALAFAVPLLAGPVRRWLQKYVWMSFAAGFGQTVPSVVGGLGVLAFAAAFIFVQIAGAAEGGRYPAGIFSAYASGVGILFAQAVLTRWLEREPAVRQVIER
jgi:hypothetical protein